MLVLVAYMTRPPTRLSGRLAAASFALTLPALAGGYLHVEPMIADVRSEGRDGTAAAKPWTRRGCRLHISAAQQIQASIYTQI